MSISSIFKDSKLKKILSANRDANKHIQNISTIEKKMDALESQRDAEISKLVSTLTNIK
jgi:hypothetical protein